MKRREFIATIGGLAAVGWPSITKAQSAAKPAQVGFLAPGSQAKHTRDPRAQAFYQAMEELGWIEGRTVVYERRFAEGHFDRLSTLARELVSLGPSVIATASSPPALALKGATTTIPVVIMDPGDPVATGLVTSLARPGGNITGVASMAPELATKRLEILNATAPAVRRVGMLYNAAIPPPEVALKEMTEAAERLRLELRPVPIRATGMTVDGRSAEGMDDALRTIGSEQADGLIVFADPLTHLHQTIIVRFTAEHRLPALYAGREFVDAGGLISYGPNYPGMFRRGGLFR